MSLFCSSSLILPSVSRSPSTAAPLSPRKPELLTTSANNSASTNEEQARFKDNLLKTKFFDNLRGKFDFVEEISSPETRRKRSSVYDSYLRQMMSLDADAAADLSSQSRKVSSEGKARKRSMSVGEQDLAAFRASSSESTPSASLIVHTSITIRPSSGAASPSILSRIRKSFKKKSGKAELASDNCL